MKAKENILFLLFLIDLMDSSSFEVTLVNNSLSDCSICISKEVTQGTRGKNWEQCFTVTVPHKKL